MTYFLNDLGKSLPDSIIEQGIAVLDLNWENATNLTGIHQECAVAALARKDVSVDTHVLVGMRYENQTEWCEYEKKFEYHDETQYLVVPKTKILEEEINR